MSYISPIEVIQGKMETRIENDIYNVVQKYGIRIDEKELIKALEYDRMQYQKGYMDGKAEEHTAKVEEQIECYATRLEPYLEGMCGNCGSGVYDKANYCSECGYKLEWK